MNSSFLPKPVYVFLFTLLGMVYITGLFVPLMDNDSAHHADIALHIYLTGDYVRLIDHAGDYLDKPHLHFWLCAFSYKIFGVTGFAYKFPSFLFSILGVFSTYKIGSALYSKEAGRLAALLFASSFAFILSNNDVRMDAILTSCIAFAIWQLIVLIQSKKFIHVVGASLGLALGFSTKGHIAVLVPALAAFFYILYLKDWRFFISWRLIALLILFGLFITPVVYCYYLQFNQHPEIVVRGKDHINGVKFILFGQSVERFKGDSFGGDAKHDYLFFLHSFLWAFAPWSIIAYIAIAKRLRVFMQRKEEWATTAVFLLILLLVSFSGFKLPHYLNIVFPTTAVIAAAFILEKINEPHWIKKLLILQNIISVLLLVLLAVITFWAFPIYKIPVIAGVVLLLAVFFYFTRSLQYNRLQKTVTISVAAMILCFFVLNTNFYPQLLKYQGGNELAFAAKGKVDFSRVYFWNNIYSSSFNFYTQTLRKVFTDSVLNNQTKTWLLYDIKDEETIKAAGYKLTNSFTNLDYEITKLDIKFVNPAKRESQCTKLVLAEISR